MLLMNIVLVLLWIGMAFSVYMLVRNNLVSDFVEKCISEWSKEAQRLIEAGESNWRIAHDWYVTYADYGLMMRKFWVWPLSKFVKESCADYVKRVQSIVNQPK